MAEGSLARVNEKIRIPAVWLLRLVVGAVFIFSGFVKAIDPWGFVYKIQEYLDVWRIDWVWPDAVMVTAVSISAAEFTLGVLMLTGSLRRSICWMMLTFMSVMLPLTIYIAIVNPVPDCGCFGDALVISNVATMLKNIALTLAIIYLIYNNNKVAGLFYNIIQWIIIVASVFYCLTLSSVGIFYQPLIDFRSFPVGSTLVSDNEPDVRLVYERNGETQTFSPDSLPDSTWTYVERYTMAGNGLHSSLAIFDGDEDVTSTVISDDGPQLILFVSDPHQHRKARASMANNLNTYIEKRGGSMIGVVATPADSLDKWISQARPTFEVYNADDTSVKEVVRGGAALVYLVDGVIHWKRNIYSLPADFPDFQERTNMLSTINSIEDGSLLRIATLIYLCVPGCMLVFSVFRLRPNKKTRKQVLNKLSETNTDDLAETELDTTLDSN